MISYKICKDVDARKSQGTEVRFGRKEDLLAVRPLLLLDVSLFTFSVRLPLQLPSYKPTPLDRPSLPHYRQRTSSVRKSRLPQPSSAEVLETSFGADSYQTVRKGRGNRLQIKQILSGVLV